MSFGSRFATRRAVRLGPLCVLTALALCLLLLVEAAFAAPGAKLWLARFNSRGNGSDSAYALVVSPDGSKVFVTGGNGDYWTVAYDTATGSRLWATAYDGAGGQDFAYAIGVSPDGSKVFVTGKSQNNVAIEDYATVAYDTLDGKQLWATRYAGPFQFGKDIAHALGVSPDGSKVFVTGSSPGPGGVVDYATVAYGTSNGNQLWATRYDGPGAATDNATALGVSPDGSKVFVTGNSVGSGSLEDYATIAYDPSTGGQLWAARYNGPANGVDEAAALGLSPDGSRVFATGLSAGDVSGLDYATVAYDTGSGAQAWAKRYNGKTNGGDDATALAVSPDGSRLFVTGFSSAPGGSDFDTVAYATSNGGKLWAKTYNGSTNATDIANAIAVSPDGSEVFVTGSTAPSPSADDYATIAYAGSTGSKLWSKKYDGPAGNRDVATALAPSPGGSALYVTGFSWSNLGLGGFDYATIAYGT